MRKFGRKREHPTTVRLPRDLRKRLERFAIEERRTRNDSVIYILQRFFTEEDHVEMLPPSVQA